MKIVKNVLLGVSISVLTLLAIVLFRTIVYFPLPKEIEGCKESINHEPISIKRDILDRFSQALRFKTITWGTQNSESEELSKFVNFIIKSFPIFHSSPHVKYEVVNNYSLLYTINGSDPTLKPYLLTSHLDVVPVELDHWNVDPFGGTIQNGYIYGRGTIDVKNIVMAILESLEFLFEKGFKPKRTFYVAFGHDEEGQGVDGAAKIAEIFTKRGITFEYLLDEGSITLNQSFPGVKDLVAMVGVTEKGFVTFTMTAEGAVGHSSMATEETAIVTLAKGISKLNSKAHKNRFGSGPEKAMLEAIAPYTSFPLRVIFSNLWLFAPLISRILAMTPSGNSFVRTTTAVTMINGGFKENVLPSKATAVVNHRIHPSQSVQEILDYDKQLVNDDRIKFAVKGLTIEPHPISPYDDDTFGYQVIKKSLRETFPGIIVIPGIMIATTDTRWYLQFTSAIYRYTPTILRQDETNLFHGHNERISIDNFVKTVNYYHHLILNSDNKELPDQPIKKDEL